mgnify:CR=1 FL=1
MEIKHISAEGRGHFAAIEDNAEAGSIHYTTAGTNMIISHTEVAEEWEGKGVGKQLVEATVLHARSAGWQIIPLCTFALAVLKRNPQWQDVVAPAYRQA